MCQFIIDNPPVFQNKTICELGAGLGLVAVLLEKLEYTNPSSLMITDGDEPTMQLLIDNKVDNECFFESSYLYWGENEDFLSSYPDKYEIVIAADVIYEDAQVEPLLDTVCAIMKGAYRSVAGCWSTDSTVQFAVCMCCMSCCRSCTLLSNMFISMHATVCLLFVTATGQFILAFARRNVSIDKVHRAAEARGLQWTIIDEHAEGVAGVEPIYSFTWKNKK